MIRIKLECGTQQQQRNPQQQEAEQKEELDERRRCILQTPLSEPFARGNRLLAASARCRRN